MKDFLKGRLITSLVVIATIILAGVAIFTASRLYQLRQQAVAPTAPESSFAWDCSKYTFSVSDNGEVKATNDSSRNEPAQQAKVYINNSLVSTLNVPALTPGQSATLGNVQVPGSTFSWRVDGTLDCSSSGTGGPKNCKLLTFSLNEPTLTLTPGPSVTLTITPTTQPGHSATPAPSTTPTGEPSATPTNSPGNSPTPTNPPSIPEAPQCTATRPSAPTITSVKMSGTSATVSWTKVDLATHYVIAYGTKSGDYPYGVPNTGNVNSYAVQSLDASKKYYFVVYAVNDCMPSNPSNTVSSVAGTAASAGEQLPATGVSIPTFLAIGSGILLLTIALLLAI